MVRSHSIFFFFFYLVESPLLDSVHQWRTCSVVVLKAARNIERNRETRKEKNMNIEQLQLKGTLMTNLIQDFTFPDCITASQSHLSRPYTPPPPSTRSQFKHMLLFFVCAFCWCVCVEREWHASAQNQFQTEKPKDLYLSIKQNKNK